MLQLPKVLPQVCAQGVRWNRHTKSRCLVTFLQGIMWLVCVTRGPSHLPVQHHRGASHWWWLLCDIRHVTTLTVMRHRLILSKRWVQLLVACTLCGWAHVEIWKSMKWKYERSENPAAVRAGVSSAIPGDRGEGNSLHLSLHPIGKDTDCSMLGLQMLSAFPVKSVQDYYSVA